MSYLTIANIPPKVGTANFNTEKPKNMSDCPKHTFTCCTFPNKCFLLTKISYRQYSIRFEWNIPNLSKNIGNPWVRQRTHCNCPASNFLSGLLLYSSPIYYQSGAPNPPPQEIIFNVSTLNTSELILVLENWFDWPTRCCGGGPMEKLKLLKCLRGSATSVCCPFTGNHSQGKV